MAKTSSTQISELERLRHKVLRLESECAALKLEKEEAGESHASTDPLEVAQDRLQESDSSLRMVLESSPFGVSIISKDNPNQRLFVNKRMAEMFGFDSSQDMLHFSASKSYVNTEDLENLRRSGNEGNFKTEVVIERCRKDGTRWWCELFRRQSIFEGEDVIISWHADITDRKHTEMAVAENIARLQAIFDNTTLNMNFKDTTGRYQMINSSYADWYGLSSEDIIGKRTSEILSDAPVIADMSNVEKTVLETGLPHQYEVQIKGKDGVLYDRRVIKFPVKTINGEINSIGTIAIDITDYKQIEKILLDAKESAETANVAKSDFLSSISHELRTPLNAIIGFSEVLKKEMFGPVGDIKNAEYINDINSAGAHLLSLINNILDLSKIEAGKEDVEAKETDIRPVIMDCLEMVAVLAKNKNIQIDVNFSNSLPTIKVDHGHLAQIFINLFSNAIKFTPHGGSVVVSAEVEDFSSLIIRMADTGIGMNAKDIAKMFENFVRGGDAMTRTETGTGLGLPLVKRLVELNDGSISIESNPGRGTVILVEFPIWRMVPKR